MTVELASKLAELVKRHQNSFLRIVYRLPAGGVCSKIGSYNIILDGQNTPVCDQIDFTAAGAFCDVTEEFARKEGEGDLSLEFWQKEHQRFLAVKVIFQKIWS